MCGETKPIIQQSAESRTSLSLDRTHLSVDLKESRPNAAVGLGTCVSKKRHTYKREREMSNLNWTREKKKKRGTPYQRIKTIKKAETGRQERKRKFNEAKLEYCREQCKDVTVVNFAQANCVTSCQKKRLPRGTIKTD